MIISVYTTSILPISIYIDFTASGEYLEKGKTNFLFVCVCLIFFSSASFFLVSITDRIAFLDSYLIKKNDTSGTIPWKYTSSEEHMRMISPDIQNSKTHVCIDMFLFCLESGTLNEKGKKISRAFIWTLRGGNKNRILVSIHSFYVH